MAACQYSPYIRGQPEHAETRQLATNPKSPPALSLVIDNSPPGPDGRVRRSVSTERPAPAPVRALLPALAPDMTVAAACHLVLRSCFLHLLDNRLPVLRGEDPEGVHQARIALRRLRAAIAIFRPIMPGDELQHLGGEARWLAGELGPVRDLDVFLGEIFAPVAARLSQVDGMAAYNMAALGLHEEALGRARTALRSRRFQLWRQRFQGWLAGAIAPPVAVARPDDTLGRLYLPIASHAATVLEKRDRQARKRGRHLARLGTAERHDLRLSLKKLRYAAEFFAAAFDATAAERYYKRLARLQAALGYLNDQAVAQPMMRRIEARMATGAPDMAGDGRYISGIVTGWHNADHRAVESALRKAWKRFEASDGFWR